MRAVVIHAPGKLEVTTVPDPTPGPRDVLVSVEACGICGTDLHILEGEFAPSLPLTPGHEFAGTVVGVGRDVVELAEGDQVAVNPSLHCGECFYCRQGRENLCERWDSIGVTRSGGAAELVAVPVASCVKLPEHVRTADAALIEPLACAVRGLDVLPRRPGDHYLIYGAGTMGLMMLELIKQAGAASVDVVDINEDKLATARQLGCSNAVTSADELSAPRGWEVVVDCTGVVAAIEDGLTRVGRGGTFLQFGVSGEKAQARFSPFRVYNEEITITGSMAILHSYERAAELFAAGVLQPDVIISDRLPLERYAEGIEKFAGGIGRKIQVQPGL